VLASLYLGAGKMEQELVPNFYFLKDVQYASKKYTTNKKIVKFTRWLHYNADNFKTLSANYMLIRLLRAYRMTRQIGKILLFIFQAVAEKWLKKFSGILFSTPSTEYRVISASLKYLLY